MNDDVDGVDRVNHSKDDEVYQPLAEARESLTEHLTEAAREREILKRKAPNAPEKL